MANDPLAGACEKLRRSYSRAGRNQTGVVVVEGLRQVERAVRAGYTVDALFVPAAGLRAKDAERVQVLTAQAQKDGATLCAVEPPTWRELSGGRHGTAAIGLCRLAHPTQPAQLVERCRDQASGVLLVLVDVEEPGNVGALVRTALAGGAAGVLTIGLSDAWHPKAIRTSMGSVFKMPVAHVRSTDFIAQELGALHRVAAVAERGAPPWEMPKARPFALLLGSEAFGLSESVVASCEQRVTVPMPAGVDSFSVNAAASVLLYEAARPA